MRSTMAGVLSLACALSAQAQLRPIPQDRGASGLGLALRRLATTGRALMVTAHPDDENNGVLVRLSRGLGLRTALLTLTRGEGGQNEIGRELGEALGVLRSEELMAVHRYDRVEQFFGRSYEFGYSFSVEETFEKWGREAALSDVVRVIRAFRPDVILTLPLEGAGGGQHHMAAAQLAKEAFRAAADPARFPDQVKRGLIPWQAKKIYQGGFDRIPGGLTLKTGVFDSLLGMSWQELGSLARASHRCQGSSQLRADPLSGEASYALVDSEPAVAGGEADLFDGIDTRPTALAELGAGSDARLSFLALDLEQLRSHFEAAQLAYDPRELAKAALPLAAGLDVIRKLKTKLTKAPLAEAARFELLDRLTQEERDWQAALALAQALDFEVTADDDEVVPGQTFTVSARAFNQGAALARIDAVTLAVPEGWRAKQTSGDAKTLEAGQALELQFQVKVGDKPRYAQPYWRRSQATLWRYDVLDNPAFEAQPFTPPEVGATLRYTAAGGVGVSLEEPALYRYEGRRVGGEKQKTVRSVPALSLELTPAIAVFPLGTRAKREFKVVVRSGVRGPVSASVRLSAPAGFSVEPAEQAIALRIEGEEAALRFQVAAPADAGAGEAALTAVAVTKDGEFREGLQRIDYDHVQERSYFTPARARLEILEVKTPPGVAVGYVMGAGDEVAGALSQLGVPVTLVSEAGLSNGDFSRYTTIVTGIRAYQSRGDLRANHNRLMRWVEAGGHLVVQYNKLDFNQLQERPAAFGFTGQQTAPGKPLDSPWAPYPGASVSTNRVTDEAAAVTFLAQEHPLLTLPNRLSSADFEGWSQERGLYLLEARDPRYQDLLASRDPFPFNPGEKRGLLVEARVGKGTWTYVGLGLFRQVSLGVDGAYRILANLVARPRPK